MSDPVLSVKHLAIAFDRAGRVVDGVSFDIAAGEIVAMVGESGSGKSTIGRAALGLLPADSRPVVTGSLIVGGVEVVSAAPATLRTLRRTLVRAVPQDPMGSLDPTMTIRRQMVEASDDAPIDDWLRRTGFSDPGRIADSYPHLLSGGERQRVLIAMAMMAKPKILIADEPTTALDVTTQAQILALLRDLAREQGTAILLITHDLAVAASMARRVLVLHKGKIVEAGETERIVRQPQHAHTRDLLASHFDLTSDRTRPLPTRSGDPAPTWAEAAPIDGNAALTLSGVNKGFPTGPRTIWGGRRPQPVLRAIDLVIRPGECVALIGQSGAGKSTILRIAAGLIRPDSGTVARGEDDPPQIVFQDAAAALTPWLTVGEQVGERLRRLPLTASQRRERVAEILGMVELPSAVIEALPHELSGGQAQRAVIARAIAVPPRLLLCDEPVSSVDVSLAASILNLLGNLRRRLGMAMLFVTHDLAAARIIADRIAVLDGGALIEDGDPDMLIATSKMAYTRELVAAVPHLHPAPQ